MLGNHGKIKDALRAKDLKDAGYSVKLAKTNKNGYEGLIFDINGDKFFAAKSKNFEGEITLDTFIIKGTNANDELRLYLTNNQSGITEGEEL